MRRKYNVGGIIDLVLNHASSNAEWLRKNPDSGYNLVNSPHLNCAYELDKLLLDFSSRYSERKVSCRSAPTINSDNDLNDLISEVSKEIYRKNFEEFFLIKLESYIAAFENYFKDYKNDIKEFIAKRNYLEKKFKFRNINLDNDNQIYDVILESCQNYGAQRYGVTLNVEFVSLLIIKDPQIYYNMSDFIKDVKKYINKVNDHWLSKAREFLKQAIENIRAYVKYEFLELKRFKVTSSKRIVENYFAVFDENDKSSIFACNGWLFGVNDPTMNFAKYGSWHYLTRSIVIWGDNAKLRYGDGPDQNPYLWAHMTKYVEDMARSFNGFRLDNAHSTPIHVAEYLMKKARRVNPDLIVLAELFAGTKEREIDFVRRIGITHLIREAVYCIDPEQLTSTMHNFGGGYENILGKLDESIKIYSINSENEELQAKNYQYLVGKKPRSIIFDLTHDNPTFHEKFNNLALNLTFITAISSGLCSVGSTRGVDQLFPYQPSVIRENRKYTYDDNFEKILHELMKLDGETELNGTKKNGNSNTGINSGSESENNSVNSSLTLTKTPIPTGKKAGEREVTFEFDASNYKNVKLVRLALSSNNWDPRIILTKIKENLFSVSLVLPKGLYYYKYVLDNNNWICDTTKDTVKDSTGNINNVLELRDDVKFSMPDLKMLRRELNKMREDINSRDRNEIFIHRDRDLICFFRMFDGTDEDYDGYCIILRTGHDGTSTILKSQIELPGEIYEFIFGCTISIPKFDINVIRSDFNLIGAKANFHFTRDIKFLSTISSIIKNKGKDLIDFHSLLPNTVIVLKIRHAPRTKEAIVNIRNSLNYLSNKGESLMNEFDLCDLNHALYKCEKEDLDNTNGKRGVYEVKGYGKLVYAGITHLFQLVQSLKKVQSLDHPLFNNVREGDWLLNYTITRFKDAETLKILYEYLNDNIYANYINLTAYVKPYFMCMIIDSLFSFFAKRILSKHSQNGELYQYLNLAVLQFTGYVNSAKFVTGEKLSLSAGLPHFSTEYMRCWGRDTFISFKGIFLIPGYCQEGKLIIKQFASTMRHGLIPNLLDSGNNPRYNARDAVWFFLQAIKEYLIFTNDLDFLLEDIQMRFLDNDMITHYSKINKGEKKIMKLNAIINEILVSHLRGIEFREWKAGKDIDEHMKEEGFNVKITFDRSTGFIHGGNQWNCGTWMDKMGSSLKAKNKGYPSTPRDGADVEIIGMLYSVLNFFSNLKATYYPYTTLQANQGANFSLIEWANLIKDNFEEKFYIVKKKTSDNFNYKENIYKDVVSYQNKSADYQLRPNLLIAMTVAPELFSTERAQKTLKKVEDYLLVKDGLGIKTLDPEDPNYNGNYENGDDSYNFKTAHGFNYHNGPEWLFPLGYYLQAKINFNSFETKELLIRYIIFI